MPKRRLGHGISMATHAVPAHARHLAAQRSQHMRDGTPCRNIRDPILAGSWYPGRSVGAGRDVDGYIAEAEAAPAATTAKGGDRAPCRLPLFRAGGGLAPMPVSRHPRPYPPRRADRPVAFVPIRGIAAPTAKAFASPLGDIPVDRAAIAASCACPRSSSTSAHRREHSLEIDLPFLQRSSTTSALVPLAVGRAKRSRSRRFSPTLGRARDR